MKGFALDSYAIRLLMFSGHGWFAGATLPVMGFASVKRFVCFLI